LARGYATQAALNDQADFPCNSTFPTWRAFLARIVGVCGSLDFGSRAASKMKRGKWAQATRVDARFREILTIPADLLARMPHWIASSFGLQALGGRRVA
jgi:hypothetical protein